MLPKERGSFVPELIERAAETIPFVAEAREGLSALYLEYQEAVLAESDHRRMVGEHFELIAMQVHGAQSSMASLVEKYTSGKENILARTDLGATVGRIRVKMGRPELKKPGWLKFVAPLVYKLVGNPVAEYPSLEPLAEKIKSAEGNLQSVKSAAEQNREALLKESLVHEEKLHAKKREQERVLFAYIVDVSAQSRETTKALLRLIPVEEKRVRIAIGNCWAERSYRLQELAEQYFDPFLRESDFFWAVRRSAAQMEKLLGGSQPWVRDWVGREQSRPPSPGELAGMNPRVVKLWKDYLRDAILLEALQEDIK